MFGIGSFEMIVVAVLALLLFSPRELPKILRSVSQFWGSLRRTADEFRDAIMQEEAMQDLKDAVDGTKAELRDVEGAARRELMKARMEARRAENKLVRVARERERREREAAKAELEAGGGEAGSSEAGAHGEASAGEAAPSGSVAGPSPAGTVAAGTSSTAKASASASPAPSTDPSPPSAPKPDDSGGGSSASQGAA